MCHTIFRPAALLFTVASCLPAAYAQPTLHMADACIVPSENFHESLCDWVDPGAAGANVTWDFSTLAPFSTFTSPWVAPSAGLLAIYPAATVTFSNQSLFQPYQAASDAFRSLGYSQGITLTSEVLSDPADELRFPFTYGDTYTDTFSGWDYFNDQQGERDSTAMSGTLTVTADGYGTLILPWGTVQNVLRVHRVRTIPSSAGIVTNDAYYFYGPDLHQAWFRITRTTRSWSTDVSEGARYITPQPEAVSEVAPATACVVMTAEGVRVSTTATGPLRVELLAGDGRCLRYWSTSEEATTYPVADLPCGIYIVRLTSLRGVPWGTQRVCVVH